MAMWFCLVVLVSLISVTVSTSSGTCQPPPKTYCTYSKPAKIDCRTTGCPPGLKCCPINWCNEYDCIVPYPTIKYVCPFDVRRCDHFHAIPPDTCQTDADCTDGKLCCLVDCYKHCVRGWPDPGLPA